MTKTLIALAAATALASITAHAVELAQPPSRFGDLDHVFLIIMENQTNTDILGSPNAPFINGYAKAANRATNYFAVGHPSAPNYLEIVGGSNFGVSNDFWPNWVNAGCVDNAPGSTGCVNAVTPIAVPGLDNGVVATATSSAQCNGQVTITGTPAPNNCALYNYPPTLFTPKSIADQLVAKHKTWKTYQESLPTVQPGVFGINYSDGAFSNLSPVSVFGPGPIQKLYAVKHNPFAYFRNIEVGAKEELSLAQVADFDGPDGLWVDLQSDAPNLSVIVPNQCHDMHGFVSGGTPICSSATAAEAGFLMLQGDAMVAKLVNGIKSSRAWERGRNAIVLVWDENDFSNSPNRVVMLVETNYARNGRVSNQFYDHFSLLRTLEAGFDLPCLNHACDSTSKVMDDMFGAPAKAF
jgi:phosphatidylinositol-3-phosphatase